MHNLKTCIKARIFHVLPQLNLSMIVDKKLGIPVMYDVYPGSIVDVSTLKNTIKKLEGYGMKDFTLVMDRGFLSRGNLEEKKIPKWRQPESVYKEKDPIEKAFKRFKRDLQALRLNTQKDSTTKGFLFICFPGFMVEMSCYI